MKKCCFILVLLVLFFVTGCGRSEGDKDTNNSMVTPKEELPLFQAVELYGIANEPSISLAPRGVVIEVTDLQAEIVNDFYLHAQDWEGRSLEVDSQAPSVLLSPRSEVLNAAASGLCRGRLLDLRSRKAATGPWFHVDVVERHWKIRFNDRHFFTLWEGLSPFRKFALECQTLGVDQKIYRGMIVFRNILLQQNPPRVAKVIAPELPPGQTRVEFQIVNGRNHNAPWGRELTIGWQVLEDSSETPRPERAHWFNLQRGEPAVGIDIPTGKILKYWWGSPDRRCTSPSECTSSEWDAELQSWGQGLLP